MNCYVSGIQSPTERKVKANLAKYGFAASARWPGGLQKHPVTRGMPLAHDQPLEQHLKNRCHPSDRGRSCASERRQRSRGKAGRFSSRLARDGRRRPSIIWKTFSGLAVAVQTPFPDAPKARELVASKAGQRTTAASRRGGTATRRNTTLATLAALATLAIFAKKPAGPRRDISRTGVIESAGGEAAHRRHECNRFQSRLRLFPRAGQGASPQSYARPRADAGPLQSYIPRTADDW